MKDFQLADFLDFSTSVRKGFYSGDFKFLKFKPYLCMLKIAFFDAFCYIISFKFKFLDLKKFTQITKY